jgi:transcription elongation factor GreA
VTLTNQDTEEESTYTIVGAQEANPAKGYISFYSPVARALIGKEEGDEVTIMLPSGQTAFDIDEVYYREVVL